MRNLFFLFIVLLSVFSLEAQNVGISETSVVPDPSAILDVNSTDKGILIPRLSKSERDSIQNPATGLLIFQTDNDPFFYYFDGSSWKKLCCDPPCENSCTYTDDYSSSTGWTQVGTGVSVSSGTVLFDNTDNFTDRRIYKPISCNLADCGDWTADFDLTVTSQTDESHPILGFTAGSAVPFYDYSMTQETNQDGVFIWMSNWCPSGDSHLSLASKNGTTRSFSFSSGGCIGINYNITYYCRFQRTSYTNLRLSVFSDPGRTIHLSGSPVNFAIPASIMGLNYIQHSNYDSQTTQSFSGTIDNLNIY